MRFKEFKPLFEEAAKFYTIGDSHAVTVATAGGKDWKNLAIGGTASTNSKMLANIAQVPKGSVVLVSQGANDTANSMRSHIDSQGKRPLVPAQKIANDVSNVVRQVQAQGAKVVFMLFPNGPGRGAGLAKYYGGDYQEEVRNAIKSAVSDVPIIDINGKPLTDGIHATMGTYKDVANRVRAEHGQGVTLGPAGSQPGAPATKEKATVSDLKKGPPFPPEQKDEVKKLQKSLVDVGYPVGPTGIDGKYGPFTAAAVSAFKKDYKLSGDGNTFASADKDMLAKVETGQVAKVAAPTSVASGSAERGMGETGSAKEAVAFFVSKGWTLEQAAGIVGNLQAESGANLKTNAEGDKDKFGVYKAYGIAQWHPPRQADFEKVYGKSIRQSNFKEQLEFIHWELENTEKVAGQYLKSTRTAEEAAWVFDQYYERSSGAHRQKRIDNALALLNRSSTATV